MRRAPALGFPVGMNPRKTIIAITTAAVFAGGGAPAHADESPPIPGGVTCTMKVKGKLALGTVLRRGLPVDVTCDGAAKVLVVPDFAAMSGASIEYDETYGARRPPIVRSKRANLAEAGTVTLRPRFTKVGKKILRHHKRTKILVGLGTEREDGHYWSDPGDWAYTKLVC